MKIPDPLKKLNSTQLNIVLHNLQLGEDRLKQCLNQKQFHEILKWGELTKKQRANILANVAEKTANVTLILNTIITSVFGAWMGFAGFMGLKLASIASLIGVTGVAAFASGYLGYQSFKLTDNEAHEALIKLKIYNVQLSVISLIKQKQKRKIVTLSKYINAILNLLGKKNSLISKLENEENFLNKKFENLLRDHSSILKKIPIQYTLWRNNFREILVGLSPTILGGFASMFVFLMGAPSVAKEFEVYPLITFFEQPIVKLIEITLAFILTIYYGFSYLYHYRNSYKRKLELKKVQEKIAVEEVTIIKVTEKIELLEKLANQIRTIAQHMKAYGK